jgi:hypothetical protein
MAAHDVSLGVFSVLSGRVVPLWTYAMAAGALFGGVAS